MKLWVVSALILLMSIARPSVAGGLASVTTADGVGDDVIRRTDLGAQGPIDTSAHRTADLLSVTMGTWHPVAPQVDVFAGDFSVDGEFGRLDLVLAGLMNPPGSVDPLDFEPFAFGDHPVYGFIEIDMDLDVDTGGEIDAPQYRYLGNVVRFGGQPPDKEVFEHRVALDGSAFDGDFDSEPYVERHGEEFHVALLGGEFVAGDVEIVSGDADFTFEAGEVWMIEASWFHRAHGFERFSVAKGSSVAGQYAPESYVQFAHDVASDTTRLSFVFALTNVGWALMHGEVPQAMNHDPTDHASVLEALNDLMVSAVILDSIPSGDSEEEIIIGWKDKTPADYLVPAEWRVTALLGSSYTAPNPLGEFFVWTDIFPNVTRGDVNGEDGNNNDDREEIDEHIEEHDGDDGVVDGAVTISGFADDFSVYDVSHDGVVNSLDVLLVSEPGDQDADGDVDLADFQRLQWCFTGSGVPYELPDCVLADLDGDGDVDVEDVKRFELAETGPTEGDDDGTTG